jgi:hypothetical protein
MLKEEAVTWFQIRPRNLRRGIQENQNHRCPERDFNLESPEYKSERLTLEEIYSVDTKEFNVDGRKILLLIFMH